MNKLNFFKKFSTPELKSISGKRYFNLIVLTCIMLLSILTIGFGESTKSYLSYKMNSPFVSFVNVTIPSSLTHEYKISDEEDFIVSKWEKDKECQKWKLHNKISDTIGVYDFFGIKQPFQIFYEVRKFINIDNKIEVSSHIKRGDKNDPILNHIINKDISDKYKYSDPNMEFKAEGWGCVVTEYFLTNKLGYEDVSKVNYIYYTRKIDDDYVTIPIEVQGIVSELPDNRDMIVGQKLYQSFNDADFYRTLVLGDTSNLSINLYVDNTDLQKFLNNINDTDIKVKKDNENTSIINNIGVQYTIHSTSLLKKQNLLKKIKKEKGYVLLYDFYSTSLEKEDDLDQEKIVFEFYDKNKLSEIGLFNSFLKENFKKGKKYLEIEMSIVEAKKNFDLFNKISIMLSYALILFSMFLIIIYITNLISSHISKNTKNLGTLKAFGLSNNNIIIIYFSISLIIILVSFILSYILSILLGSFMIGNLAKLIGIANVSNLDYISYSLYILMISFIVLPSILIFMKLRYSLRGKTPGDLIYERD
jgi:hypothetical protein